jgi:hypothetical protein
MCVPPELCLLVVPVASPSSEEGCVVVLCVVSGVSSAWLSAFVQAVMEKINAKFGIEVEFADCPTGL